MIWTLVGYDHEGDERPVVEQLLSADFIQGGIIIVCPLDESMTSRETQAIADMLGDAGIKAVVFWRPIQVWKIEPPDEPH